MGDAASEQEAFKAAFQSFIKRATTGSVSELSDLISDFVQASEALGKVPEAAYKHAIATAVDHAFHRYADRLQLNEISKLVQTLAKLDAFTTLKYLSESVLTTCVPNVAIISNRSTTSASYFFRYIADLLLSNIGNDSFKPLKQSAFSALSSAAFFAAVSKPRVRPLTKTLKALSAKDPNFVIDGIKALLAQDAADLRVLVVIALLLPDEANKSYLTTTWLEVYNKGIMLSKTLVPAAYFTSVNRVLSNLTSAEVKNTFLPNSKKALLRGPEVAAPAVVDFVRELTLESDDFAEEFLQIMASSLASTIDSVRTASVEAVSHMGLLIGNGDTLAKYIEALFVVYQTNSSKQPIRLAAAEAISNVVANEKVSTTPKKVVELFANILPTEQNEQVLAALWSAFEQWLLRGAGDQKLDTDAIAVLKKGASGKAESKSAALRVAALVYDKFATATIDPDILNSATQICTAAKTEQVVNVDFIPAAAILLRAVVVKGEAMDAALFDVLDTKKSLTRDRILTSFAGANGAVVIAFAKRAVMTSLRPHGKDHYPSIALNLLIATLISPDHGVRRAALKAVLDLFAVEGVKLQTAVMHANLQAVEDGFLSDVYHHASTASKLASSGPDDHRVLPAALLVRVLIKTLPSKKISWESDEDYTAFLVESLFVASLTKVVEQDGGIWINWVSTSPELSDLVHSEVFCTTTFDRVLATKNDPILRTNVIRLLLSVHFKNSTGDDTGAFIETQFWTRFSRELFALDLASYAAVTANEAGIFRFPEGKLYNEQVIDDNSDLNLEAKNVKRENKAYSHKEQLAEIQLRKELAEKNRREGKLTDRQKKAANAELRKESETRARLRVLYDAAEPLLTVIAEAARYNPQGACTYVSVLYDIVVPLLQSHLVSREAALTFLAFSDAFFEPSTDCLGALVGTAALRVLGAIGYADAQWPESLVDQLTRVFKSLTALCIIIDVPLGEEAFEDDHWQDTISVWKLSFLIPVIEKVLPSQYPQEFKLKVTHFIRSAVNSHFLSASDVVMSPISRLHRFILQQIVADPYADVYEDLRQTISAYCLLLRDVEEPQTAAKEFFVSLIGVLKVPNEIIRLRALEWLTSADNYLLKQIAADEEFKTTVAGALFLARFDVDTKTSNAAGGLWQLLRLHETVALEASVWEAVSFTQEFVQNEAAEAVRELGVLFPEKVPDYAGKIFGIYDQWRQFIPAVKDDVGRVIQAGRDPVTERLGAGKALFRLSDCIVRNQAENFIEQISERFDDRDAHCHTMLRNAGSNIIRNHGREIIQTLLPYLEDKLEKTPETIEGDDVRLGLVVLLGTLGQYLGDDSAKVLHIFQRLIVVLSTPSELVQKSVASCLPRLVPLIEDSAVEAVNSLIGVMEVSKSYGERRGAAYGIAAIIAGLRPYVIIDLDLLKKIDSLFKAKGNETHRESALLIIEMLFTILGTSSEPFIPHFLPSLLMCYGDSSAHVRKASAAAGQSMMAALSKYGAKLVVPLILKSTAVDNARTKCACAGLLGAVSKCAPRQLSSSLPKVVPQLVQLLTDSHHHVQKAGIDAFNEIAGVIRNPEIMSIAPHLIAGLVDPVNKTRTGLSTVVNTRFIHYMDPPSLALIMPLIHRAFNERNAEGRQMGAQIVANIYSLTDRKDMEPYLSTLIPGLKTALLDPVPEVRTVAARAFGAVLRCSDEHIRDQVAAHLVPWLKKCLVSDTSAVDRSGAAQGLAEVIAAFGEHYLDASMPEIIQISSNPKTSPYIRDGYLLLFIYLPVVLRDRFVHFLADIVPPLLVALADENEIVRATALKAGQQLITMYVTQARNTLLPKFQDALFDSSWRIRHAAVQLIGDYLFNISGVSGKGTSTTANDDDTLGVEAINATILENLGRETRDSIFSGLYLCRQDVALVVRQAANHVWKVIVPNTPRILRDVMSTLFSLLLKCLASTSSERQQTAARCLGEVVKKMGERLLSNVLPILRTNLDSEAVECRLGVAEALNQVIQNCSRETVATNAGAITIILNRCLSDGESVVRAAAAPPFNLLMQIVGPSAVDEIVLPMVDRYTETGDEDTLDALCMITGENPKSFLPPILPKLMRPPVNAQGLCRIAAAAGSEALNKHLPQFLTSLLSFKPSTAEETEKFVAQCLPMLMAITEPGTMHTAVGQLFEQTLKHDNVVGIALVKTWVNTEKAMKTLMDTEGVLETILGSAVKLYASDSVEIVSQAIDTVTIVVRAAEHRQVTEYLGIIKASLEYVADTLCGDGNTSSSSVATQIQPLAFTKPTAFSAFQRIVKEALFNGGTYEKSTAIVVVEHFTRFATAAAVGTHAIFIAGPLIRSLGDRQLIECRKSSLSILKTLLEKVPTNIRPFIPQIQTELVKLLRYENVMPFKALFAACFCHSLCLHVKSEDIVNDLVTTFGPSEDPKTLEVGLLALREVIPLKHKTYTEGTLDNISTMATSHLLSPNAAVARSAAGILGQLVLTKENLGPHVATDIVKAPGNAYVLEYCLWKQREHTIDRIGAAEITAALTKAFQSTDGDTVQSAIVSAVYLLIGTYPEVNSPLVSALARLINNPSNEVKILVGNAFSVIATEAGLFEPGVLKGVVPSLINGTQEKNSAVRLSSELALIDVFALSKSADHFEKYAQTLEGAARTALDNINAKFLQKRLATYQSQTLESINTSFVVVF